MLEVLLVHFAERFCALLDERELSTYRLAIDLGMSDTLIGYWKRGKRQPAMDNLIKLADYFDVSIDYLVGRSDVKERK